MRQKLFMLITGILGAFFMAGCKMDALTEEVLTISLQDGEWNMEIDSGWGDEKTVTFEIGPKCDIDIRIQYMIVSDLENDEADEPSKDESSSVFYVFDGTERLKKTKNDINNELESPMFMFLYEFLREDYEENKEMYKEEYIQFKKRYKDNFLKLEYKSCSKTIDELELLIERDKCEIMSQNTSNYEKITEGIENYKRKNPDKSINKDGIISESYDSTWYTGEDVWGIIYGIENLPTDSYTIKTNSKRTKYQIQFNCSETKYNSLYSENVTINLNKTSK